MSLPAQYGWLSASLAQNSGRPLMVAEALRFYGVQEIAGPKDNPIIMGWASEVAAIPGKEVSYHSDDKEAWCGLFMAHLAHATGNPFPDKPLWALNWSHFGLETSAAALGDVLVFYRYDEHGEKIGGHVGLYVGEDDRNFFVLGGNEGNQVAIRPYPIEHKAAVRRPAYPGGQPHDVKQYRLAANGELSASRG